MAGAVGLSPRRLRRQHGQQHVPGFRVILHTLFIFSGVQASMARNVVVASICVIRVISFADPLTMLLKKHARPAGATTGNFL